MAGGSLTGTRRRAPEDAEHQWTRAPMAGAMDMTPPPPEMLPEGKGKEKLSAAALLPAPGFHQSLPPTQSKAS